MLRQEINLYRAFEKPKPAANFLTWKRFGQYHVVIFVLLCIIYLYSSWQVHYLSSQKTALQQEADELQTKFFNIKKQFPALFFTQDINQSVTLLKQELEAQKKLLQSLVTPVPFSQDLIGLASVIVPDVWLTQINVTSSGNEILIKGKSLNMSSIQTFYGNLLREKTFTGFTINLDDVSTPDKTDKDGNLLFQLSMTKRV